MLLILGGTLILAALLVAIVPLVVLAVHEPGWERWARRLTFVTGRDDDTSAPRHLPWGMADHVPDRTDREIADRPIAA